jgi:hypothetical protein
MKFFEISAKSIFAEYWKTGLYRDIENCCSFTIIIDNQKPAQDPMFTTDLAFMSISSVFFSLLQR